jgi:hypothetical protein
MHSIATHVCTTCKQSLPSTEFYPHRRARSGLQPNCRKCSRQWHRDRPDYIRQKNAEFKRKNPTYALDWHRITTYGVTPDQVSAMRAKQGGVCPGCLRALSTVRECVDHCHSTGMFRGLLCNDCNISIGRLSDCAKTLRRLADYLEAENYA